MSGANEKRPNLRPKVPTGRRAIWGAVGAAYLTVVAAIVSELTETPFWLTFLGLMATVLALFVCGLVVAVRWALGEDGRQWQIQLGQLFLLVAMAAILLAALRWFIVAAHIHMNDVDAAEWFGIALQTALIVLVTAPLALHFFDVLLGIAAWFVWLPAVQKWLRDRRHNDSPKT